MKTAVEVLGYTAAPCCLWPLPTSAVCSNPGRECPYLLPLTKASLLPLGIIKTVVCLSAKLLQQLQKVIESATRLAPGAVTQRGCPCWDSSTARGAWDRQGLQGWEPWCSPIGLALSSHPRAPLSPLCFFPFNFCYTCLTTKKASRSVNPLLKIGCIIFGRGFGSQGRFWWAQGDVLSAGLWLRAASPSVSHSHPHRAGEVPPSSILPPLPHYFLLLHSYFLTNPWLPPHSPNSSPQPQLY